MEVDHLVADIDRAGVRNLAHRQPEPSIERQHQSVNDPCFLQFARTSSAAVPAMQTGTMVQIGRIPAANLVPRYDSS